MRMELIRELEKEVINRGFSEAVASRAAWAARMEYQARRYDEVADLAERLNKTPVDVYTGILARRFTWVWPDCSIDEAAFGSLLPHIPDDVRRKLTLTAEWEIERDSNALCITFSNMPYFDRVVLSPIVDEDGRPRICLTADNEWCCSWKIPAALYHVIREEIEFTIGKAVVWRRPLPPTEEVERLLAALSPEAAEAAQKEEEEKNE